MTAAKDRRDRAWGVMAGASLCMACGIPSVIYYTFGLFVPEVIASTHWSPVMIAGAIGPGAMTASLIGPVIGRLSDRWGARAMALAGGPALGFGMVLLGWAAWSAASFVAFTMVMFVMASFAGTPIPYAQTLTGWFDRRRGLALGVMFCTGAIGIAVWPLLAAALISHVGWRHAYMVLGASAGCAIGLGGLLLRKPPQSIAAAKGQVQAVPGLALHEAIRTRRFWQLAAIFLVLSAVLGGMAVELPVILRKGGANPQAAATATSVIGGAMFLGRLSLSLVLDRWFAPRMTAAIVLVASLAFPLLMTGDTRAPAMLAAALLGFGIGTEYAVAAYMTSRAFGLRAYGAIYGLIVLATGLGLGAGPAVIGMALARDVSAPTIDGMAMGLLLATVLMLFGIRPPDLPFHDRHVHRSRV